MNTQISYSDLPLLTCSVEENVEQLVNHGADKIELLMDGIQWDRMDEQIKKIGKALRLHHSAFSVHPPAWDTNLTSENQAIRTASYEEYKKAIEFAHEIEAEHVVIHPGFCFSPAFDKAGAQQRAQEYLHQLCQVAGPLGVKLAVENVGYNGASIYSEQEYLSCLDQMDHTAGYLIDTGHAHLNGWDIPQMIRSVKERLFSVHIHDNSGVGDEHLPIGEGSIHWQPIYDALQEVDAPCQLILEYSPGTALNQLVKGKQLLRQHLAL
ncbi:xylose isomerase domain-containing protein [Paenibacillus terrae HPL-003]|uniref:Xylose isomerase domain-containing protein n=1 Tax=Paenibacillus terrae (strain HPL-003) TaxID=985665 RepID=G7W1K8_PAETH|nr:sugar phosphate isomerase/epimerase family protein [Paenibacillus terrae]AET58012.1 xylose isomerase domain-containing protein [Paenibacillus terrae HPL-003]